MNDQGCWSEYSQDGNNGFVAVAQGSIAATMQLTANIAPPTIAITSPSTWSQAGTITQVQFFNGSTLLGTSTQSPYTVNWNNVAAGTYSITAVATDNTGQTTRSSEQTKTKVRHPQTNGICERFHKTILQEFYQTNDRTHQGKMCCGRTPMQALIDENEAWRDEITVLNN